MSKAKDMRKDELKRLYRQYDDLPNEIVMQIVEFKDKQKNNSKPISCRDIIKTFADINNQIKKIEAELFATTKLQASIPVKELLFPSFYSAYERQMQMDMLHTLRDKKRILLNECMWMAFAKKQKMMRHEKLDIKNGEGAPVLFNDSPIGIVKSFDGKLANAILWGRYIGTQTCGDGSLAAIEINVRQHGGDMRLKF